MEKLYGGEIRVWTNESTSQLPVKLAQDNQSDLVCWSSCTRRVQAVEYYKALILEGLFSNGHVQELSTSKPNIAFTALAEKVIVSNDRLYLHSLD